MQEIYLDNSATTKPLPEVIDKIKETLITNYGNPSSLHNKGLKAEKILKRARRLIADKLGIKPEELYFTSGGTESNNLAIKGISYQFQSRGKHLITTMIEHSSVLEVFKSLEKEGYEVTYLQPDKKGIISPQKLARTIRPETILVSIMHVNNELGSIQPVKKAGKIIKEKNHKTFFHVDAIQSFGKININPSKWNIDLLSLSGHKFHGPKGIGALYLKKRIKLVPLIHGGGQEEGLRSGTENISGIAGLIPAIKKLPSLITTDTHKKQLYINQKRDKKLDRLKNYFIKTVKNKLPRVKINSPLGKSGAPHIINLSFPEVKGEILVHCLEKEGIYVSTGSACHSKDKGENRVLKAIGLNPELRKGTIRISLSRFNNKEELDYTVKKLKEQIKLYF